MQTRERLLAFLEENKGRYLSGEQIAQALLVSRAAVWKAAQALRAAGYPIDAVRNRGYCLSPAADILSAQGIAKYLKPACSGLHLQVVPEIASTNTAVRARAAEGAPEGWTVVSGSQTRGRGRIGRTFFSPPDTGIYLSLLLRPPHCQAQEAVQLTTMAAVAVCEAIEELSGVRAQIKWVNDIFIGDKKVCGILTEAALGLEDGFLEYAVLGVGINVYPPKDGFPAELRDIAGSVFAAPQDDGKNRMTAAFLNHFMADYQNRDASDYAARYRARSLAIGRDIWVMQGGQACRAHALDVDDACRLHVRYEDGRTACLTSGEISIRMRDHIGGIP